MPCINNAEYTRFIDIDLFKSTFLFCDNRHAAPLILDELLNDRYTVSPGMLIKSDRFLVTPFSSNDRLSGATNNVYDIPEVF